MWSLQVQMSAEFFMWLLDVCLFSTLLFLRLNVMACGCLNPHNGSCSSILPLSFFLSTQIINYLTLLSFHMYGQLPHHGKKFWTTKDDKSLWLYSILLLLYVDFSILQRFTSSLVTLSLGNFTYIASVKPCSLFYSTVRSTYRWLFLLAEHCLPAHMGSQFTCSSTKRELTQCTVCTSQNFKNRMSPPCKTSLTTKCH